jgi:glutamine synthetase
LSAPPAGGNMHVPNMIRCSREARAPMQASSIQEDLRTALETSQASRVYVAVCDLQGQLRGKSISRDKFLSALDKGISFPPILPAADFTDVVHPVALDAAASRLGDGIARIFPETRREIPWERPDCNQLFLCEMSGSGAATDPRALYRRIEERASTLGLVPLHACEYECTLLNETHESVHEKDFRDLRFADNDAALYGLWRHSARSEFWTDFVTAMQHMGIDIEACHWELAAGAIEAVMRRDAGVRAADNAAIYRAFARSFARRRGMMLTFMARLSHLTAGHSGHVHISLRDRAGTPVFHEAGAEGNMSRTFLQFIGGLQALLPELLLMLLPNVNSWRRLGESAWSFDPRWCRWGVDNRSVPLRVMPGAADDLHLEVRIPGADANPYLALACVLAAGLWGIENGARPTAPQQGNAFRSRRRGAARHRLPQSFPEAIARFRASRRARELFGSEFVRVFAETRAAQELEFREKVSEWELRRFLELA